MTAGVSVRAVVALLALALATRLVAAGTLGGGFYFADETEYLDAADRLLAGRGFDAGYDRVPAYPLVLAVLRAVAPGGVAGVRILQAAVTAIGCVLVVALGRHLFGGGAALVAGVLYALDPLLVGAAGLLYPDALAAVVLLAAMLLAVRAARQDRVAAAAGAGVALGVLAQLRPAALVLVPAVSVWIGFAADRRRLLGAVGVVVACLAAFAPWTYRSYRVHGTLSPIATRGAEAAPVSPESVEAHGLVGSLVRQAWSQPASFGSHVAREFLHFWELYPQRLTTDNAERRATMRAYDERLPAEQSFPVGLRDVVSALSFGAELTLAVVGLVTVWPTRRREASLLLAVILCFALAYAPFVARLRYRIPVLPLLLLFAGSGAVAVGRSRRARAISHRTRLRDDGQRGM